MTDVTLSEEMLQRLLTQAVATALTAKGGKGKTKEKKARPPMTEEQKAANRAKVDAETIVNFTAQGYKDVRPRENVRTYDKWIENGRRVRRGEKSTKCGSWPLFHYDQTDPFLVPTSAADEGAVTH